MSYYLHLCTLCSFCYPVTSYCRNHHSVNIYLFINNNIKSLLHTLWLFFWIYKPHFIIHFLGFLKCYSLQEQAHIKLNHTIFNGKAFPWIWIKNTLSNHTYWIIHITKLIHKLHLGYILTYSIHNTQSNSFLSLFLFITLMLLSFFLLCLSLLYFQNWIV